MKLIKCYISSFGKFKDFEFDFNDNLNVIMEKNGWGKSTFAIFVKSMFYGLKDSKKSISDNERKKYTPWDSSEKFGGYVIFERDGNEFKVVRFFGKKPADDSVSLIDLKTGKVYPNQENLGKRLFGVDEEGFTFSTFLSQNNFSITPNATLTAKYDNSYGVENDNLFVNAIEKLQVKSKFYAMRGEKGEIFDLKRQIAQIKEKLNFSKNARSELDTSSLKLKELDKIIEDIKKEIVVCNENISKVKSVVEYNFTLEKREKLFNTLKALEDKKQNALNILNGNVEKASLSKEYMTVLEDYSKTLNAIKIISEDLESLKAKQTNNVSTKKQIKKPLIFIGPIIFVLSALCFFISGTAGGIALGVSAIVGLGMMLFGLNNSKKIQENPYEELILEKEKELKDFCVIKDNYEKVLNDYISLFTLNFNDYKEALDCIKNTLNEYNLAIKSISEVSEEIKNTSLNPSIDKSKLNINADEVSKRIKELNSLLTVRERERGDLIAGVKTLEAQIDSVLDLETQLGVLEERLENSKVEYEAISFAIDFLTKADENVKIRYRKPLEDSLNKYLSLLGGEYLATIDVDLNVSIIEKGAQKSTDYYSEGLRNLFDICKRFAIIDVLFQKEKPFIILDDPFSNFDKERLDLALNLLEKLKDEYQILYLVCHDSRCKIEK